MKLLLIISISMVSTQLTRWIIKEKGLSPIRTSTMLTLAFYLMTLPFDFQHKLVLQSAFLGATFVGMSETGKMSEWRLFWASLVYSLLFYYVLPFNIGLGGALGFAAFMSCLFVQFMRTHVIKASIARKN
ncbi:hypothetical protein ACJVC5_18995 [Peredibacter sp. HCB2-198]|uniref:hypothetical protein n=1 Tax=Peredibacter sp. HCB2-198 TaxID=3383025 RepID=UPI0038B5EC58